jgi:hypothetical protein
MEGVESKQERVERVLIKALRAFIKHNSNPNTTAAAADSDGAKKRPRQEEAAVVQEPAKECMVHLLTGVKCTVSDADRVTSKVQTKHNDKLIHVCKRCKLDMAKERKKNAPKAPAVHDSIADELEFE